MIVIDPGHGGSEPNNFRIAPDGMREAEINLNVALALAQRLKDLGIDFRLTRTDDVSVSLEDRIKDCTINDLFISIHHNSYEPSDIYSSFPIVHVDQSFEYLGCSLLSSFEKFHPRSGSCIESHAVFDTGLFVLVNSPCPAVLGEFDFFSSNSHQRKYFYQDEVNAYLDFILNFLQGILEKPKAISDKEINRIFQLYPKDKFPAWGHLLKKWDKTAFESLKRQDRLCPLIGRLNKGQKFYLD